MPCVAFDFDDTLFDVWNGKPIYVMTALARAYQIAGYTLYIVTARGPKDDEVGFGQSIAEWCQDQGVYPDGVYFTNGHLKSPVLCHLGVDTFFDDNAEMVKDAVSHGIMTYTIPWDDFYGSTIPI